MDCYTTYRILKGSLLVCELSLRTDGVDGDRDRDRSPDRLSYREIASSDTFVKGWLY